jgi:hypothetical protein
LAVCIAYLRQGESRSPNRDQVGLQVNNAGLAAETNQIGQTGSYSKACASCYRANVNPGMDRSEDRAKRDRYRIVSIKGWI